MPFVEVIIECSNCDNKKKIEIAQSTSYISVPIEDFTVNCCKCDIQGCENCTLIDIEDNTYCQDCYFKYVQKGLITKKLGVE